MEPFTLLYRHVSCQECYAAVLCWNAVVTLKGISRFSMLCSVLRWFDVSRYDGSCIFAGRLFLLLLINEYEIFEHLPFFRSYLSNWRSISLYLFVSFSMDVIVLQCYVHCPAFLYRILSYSFIAILYRLVFC